MPIDNNIYKSKEYKNVLANGFVDNTTERQKQNGTLSLQDKDSKIIYTISDKYVRIFKPNQQGAVLKTDPNILDSLNFIIEHRKKDKEKTDIKEKFKNPTGIKLTNAEFRIRRIHF